MQTEPSRQAFRFLCAGQLALAFLLALPGAALAALCGDTSGDGFVRTSDARATLKLAVMGGYDRRGDVAPKPSIPVADAGDGKLSASDALETLKASVESRTPVCRGATDSRVVVTTSPTDFSSAGFAVVDIATRAFTYRAGALNGDAVVRTPGDVPLVINRHNYNTLQFLDVNDEDLPTINDCSVVDGPNPNPQDVLLLSPSKGYLTPYAGASLQVFSPPVLFEPELDPSCASIFTGHIDLSGFDADGVPEMDQMARVGDEVFVTLQRLDAGHQPTQGNGAIAIIDTNTDTVAGSIPLSFANPFAETKGIPYDEFSGLLYVGGPGDIDLPDDGGIEAIDPVTRSSKGMLVTGADVHRNIFDYVIVGSRRAFAVLADDCSIVSETCANSVVDLAIGPAAGDRKILATLVSSSTALITDIEMTERGELWVAYRGESKSDPPGLLVFRVADDLRLTPSPIGLGQSPFTLDFIP